ncbi:MAG: DUF2784 domain-containing protein [Verrucomicrobia bacterium]|nr:MAG: DUF2784 domain-containing protein [Verrucomicrobiota bacterium]
MSAKITLALADGVLILHVAFVVFVVIGWLTILLGGVCRWPWIRHRLFRQLHLTAIGIVVIQAWLGIVCPLTILEKWLRERAGTEVYEGSFIAHWLHQILFFEAPPWVFVMAYSIFGLGVIISWWRFPPKPAPSKNC